jgi:hypothetical protein
MIGVSDTRASIQQENDMTTTVKFAHVSGNKAIELVDQNGQVHGTLDAVGRSIEITMHSDLHITAREVGEFFGSERQGAKANASVDAENTDAE